MKKLKLFLIFVMALSASVLLCSCQPKITVDEVKAALPDLVEASNPLNEIYFGEGFKEADIASDLNSYFYCDTEKSGLNSILQIKEATEKVFTAEYAEVLYETAFLGASTDISAEGARFIEGEMGLMQKKNDNAYTLPDRVFDYDSIEIIKGGRKRVIISISTTASGKTEVIEMVVSRYGDEGNFTYRLDSPTY